MCPSAMKHIIIKSIAKVFLAGTFLLMCLILPTNAVSQDPLPSWNEGTAKQAIVKFVQTVTDRSNPQYVPSEQRIAAFDNNGTLWAEQPLYFQGLFAFDRVNWSVKGFEFVSYFGFRASNLKTLPCHTQK